MECRDCLRIRRCNREQSANEVSLSNPSARDLARKLLSAQRRLGARADNSLLLNEQLQLSLVRFAGADGFGSLLGRAIVLSSTTIPALRHVKVGAAGQVEGLEPAFIQDQVLNREAGLVVTAQLLELLVSFIGESLTRRIVDDACLEPSSDE